MAPSEPLTLATHPSKLNRQHDPARPRRERSRRQEIDDRVRAQRRAAALIGVAAIYRLQTRWELQYHGEYGPTGDRDGRGCASWPDPPRCAPGPQPRRAAPPLHRGRRRGA